MNRLRLAAFILTAGLIFIGGCTASYSFGTGLGMGGRFFNGHNRAPIATPECPATPCCESGIISGFGDTGPILMPQDSMNMFPPAHGVPPGLMPGTMPGAIPTPAGSSTKLIPVPQANPAPYTQAVH